ncbi:MAG: NAD-dependent malic enzyme [Acidobacteria bacterium RIFCSPLOWO2_12_FULL_67_14b]|nr:MAG: NAD-dependent malic enzyme [Acidobacteria bacterium RIFCSPLOWO2_12_FULL_67_14b]
MMEWSIEHDSVTGEEYIAVDMRGEPLLRDPFTNKSTAFTAAEREALGLDGLVPPAISTIDQQLARVYENYRVKQTPLERYIHLASLQDRNETLFFRLVHDHIAEMMPIVYTPVVGQACQQFSHIYRRPRGLYISYEQRDRIDAILANHARPPAVIVVTDGERILGLGDQGVGGMGIPTGKLSLYTACAGIPPYLTLPIMLDVGTGNQERLNDPLYLGLRHQRIRGAEYQDFIDRFVEAVMRVYPAAVLQWEDFLKANAITQLARFGDRLCTFNDDIQGTAAVVVAGLYAALRITGQAMRDQRVVLGGAGAAAQGIANLFVAALCDAGLSHEEARRRICTVDSRGLVTEARADMEDFKAAYARPVADVASYVCRDPGHITLEETVRNFAPTILVGTSGTSGLFTEGVIRAMAAANDRPIVFPLSNPTSKSECTAEEAIRWSDGRAIVATGSPFDPVVYGGRTHRIGQGNNAFVFPGVGLGLWAGGVRRATNAMFLDAARALAQLVSQADLDQGAVYPELTRIRHCSHAVACAVIRRAVAEGHAAPEVLPGLEETVSRAMWFPAYRPMRYRRHVPA